MVDFLLLGNEMAVTYNVIFPLVKNERVMYGYSISSGDRMFEVPDDYEFYGTVYKEEDDKRFIAVSGVRWITSMRDDYPPPLVLSRKYVEGDYKKFDDTDIINIDKSKDIPYDYDGVMGVPVTFLDKWNPEQFDVIGLFFDPPIDGVIKYLRILIRKK